MAAKDQDKQVQLVEPQAAPAPPPEEKPTKEPIGLTYKGDGRAGFTGVARRDLTVHELLDLEPAVINNITAKGLYVVTKAGEDARAKEHADG